MQVINKFHKDLIFALTRVHKIKYICELHKKRNSLWIKISRFYYNEKFNSTQLLYSIPHITVKIDLLFRHMDCQQCDYCYRVLHEYYQQDQLKYRKAR